MGFIQRLQGISDQPAPITRKVPPKRPFVRQYDGNTTDRLSADWQVPEYTTGDSEIRNAINRVRERAREQARNNPWVASFRAVMARNVVGAQGFVLRSLATTARGKADKPKREAIEASWTRWQRKVTVDDKHSMRGLCASALDSYLIDGECFIVRRLIKGVLKLQFLEADCLDYQKNELLSDGHDIRLGVERDGYGKPLAYWFFKQAQGDASYTPQTKGREHIRIASSEVIHFYDPDRPNDTRGISTLVSALFTLKQLTEYEKAEVVAARKQASEGVFFELQVPTDWGGNVEETQVAEDDEAPAAAQIDIITEIGQGVVLPPGVKANYYNPTHPNSQFAYFVTACVRKFAASRGISYHTLAGDLEKVNYSSAQIGGLEEQETWRMLQCMIVEKLLCEVFDWWLDAALLAGSINGVTYANKELCELVEFNGRVWLGADPRKDAMANQIAVDNGWKSPQAVIRESTGRDPWTVLEERKEWELWHEELDLDRPMGGMVTETMNAEVNQEDVDASP